jgi:hypothetical protein
VTKEQVFFALLVGLVSTLGAFLGSWFSSKATLKSSANALHGIDRQIRLQSAAKLAEFRQAWINGLREAMAKYQAHGAISNMNDENMRELFKFHAEISLMMNRNDINYLRLQSAMDCFLHAPDSAKRFLCRDEFLLVCQDILKTEWDVLKEQLEAATTQ